MRKIMKRGFCLFLVAVLLAGLVPYAFADETKPTGTAEVSEAATEPTEETAETIEPEEDEIADGQLLLDGISTYASTVSNVLLFDQASPNYTTVLKSQISVTYQPNGTDAAKTAYIKNLGWHFARYNNTPYPFEEQACIVCNDEGKINGLPLNRAIRDEDTNEIVDIIAGTFFICDCRKESFGSLSEEQQKRYLEKYRLPERFFRTRDGIEAVPYKPKDRDR